jgi:AbrB family looped-hinge helix DNA binding protein
MASPEYIFEVNGKGEIVIPAEVAEELSLKKGAKVAIKQEGKSLIVTPIQSYPFDAFRGSTKGTGAYRDREHRKDRSF